MSRSSPTKTCVVTPPWRFVPAAVFGGLSVLGFVALIGTLVFAAVVGETVFLRRYGIFLAICGTGCLIGMAMGFLATTREVILEADVILVRRWLQRDVELGPSDVLFLRPLPLSRTLFVLRHRNGWLLLPFGFDGFHEVVSATRRLNPDAKIRGC